MLKSFDVLHNAPASTLHNSNTKYLIMSHVGKQKGTREKRSRSEDKTPSLLRCPPQLAIVHYFCSFRAWFCGVGYLVRRKNMRIKITYGIHGLDVWVWSDL